jgi:hypothetical protein
VKVLQAALYAAERMTAFIQIPIQKAPSFVLHQQNVIKIYDFLPFLALEPPDGCSVLQDVL